MTFEERKAFAEEYRFLRYKGDEARSRVYSEYATFLGWVEEATKQKSKLFIEVGVFRASNSSMIAEFVSRICPTFTFMGVDLDIQNLKDTLWVRKLRKHVESGNAMFYGGESLEFAKKIACQASFVFIDACHCYECVKKDIEAWKHKIELGGYLAFHDTSIATQNRGYTCCDTNIRKTYGVLQALEDSDLLDTFSLHDEVLWAPGYRCYRRNK